MTRTEALPAARESNGRSHLPALDGVRGIAILWVMLLHFARPGVGQAAADQLYWRFANTGRMGVDLFFVLSGFLITRILCDTRGLPSYFRAFYARRFLRIFPLYYLAVALALFAPPLLFGAGAGRALLHEHQGWFWLYGVNYLVAREGWAAAGGLEHFWSLAVEEQFYLVWPLVVLLAPRRRLFTLSVAALVAAPVLRALSLLGGASGEALYVSTHLRPDGFLVGALVALALRGGRRPERLHGVALAVVAAGVAVEAGLLLSGGALPGWIWVAGATYTLVSLWCGAVVLAAATAHPDSRLARWLCRPWLRTVGKYSYAAYIFHILVRDLLLRAGVSNELVPTVFGSGLPGQVLFSLAAGAASLLVAAASWHLLEKHLVALKRFFPYGAADQARAESRRPAGVLERGAAA
jgi:peptidoglycan/LPS O-acetylase OafA/YrhL